MGQHYINIYCIYSQDCYIISSVSIIIIIIIVITTVMNIVGKILFFVLIS